MCEHVFSSEVLFFKLNAQCQNGADASLKYHKLELYGTKFALMKNYELNQGKISPEIAKQNALVYTNIIF